MLSEVLLQLLQCTSSVSPEPEQSGYCCYKSCLILHVFAALQLLNAKPENVERESEIVAQSGRAGQVTIATNMAGRGTDILLGGNPDFMARWVVSKLSGAMQSWSTALWGFRAPSIQDAAHAAGRVQPQRISMKCAGQLRHLLCCQLKCYIPSTLCWVCMPTALPISGLKACLCRLKLPQARSSRCAQTSIKHSPHHVVQAEAARDAHAPSGGPDRGHAQCLGQARPRPQVLESQSCPIPLRPLR